MGTYRSVLKSRNTDGQEFRNIHTFDYTGILATLTADLTSYFNALLNATFLAAVANTITFYAHDDYEWDGNEWQPVGTANLSKVGTDVADQLPNQMAGVIVAKTIGKRRMGRKFLVGPTEARNTAGAPTAAYLTAVAAYLAVYAFAYVAAGGTLSGGVWDAVNHVFRGFTGGVADGLWGTQRRRKVGVGI